MRTDIEIENDEHFQVDEEEGEEGEVMEEANEEQEGEGPMMEEATMVTAAGNFIRVQQVMPSTLAEMQAGEWHWVTD